MPLESILSFFLITLVATATPGPTMLFIAACGLSNGVAGYIAGGLGVLVADLLYFILTVTGLSVVLLASEELFYVIKWIGVFYLIYLGVQLIFLRNSQTSPSDFSVGEFAFRKTFLKGFLIHLANPKTILFFSALLPQFINPTESLYVQMSIIALILIITQAATSILYGAMADVIRRKLSAQYLRTRLNVVSGFILIIAGAWLATLRRV